MEALTGMLHKLPGNLPAEVRNTVKSYDDYVHMQCDALNAEEGRLTGYDCQECRNKGFVYGVNNGELVSRRCRCAPIRESLSVMESSGLGSALQDCTFDRYTVAEDWQKELRDDVRRFADAKDGSWLLVCGQVGCGKTHLCTAAVGEFIRAGYSARYMLWRDEAVQLKACVNDDEAYYRRMFPLKTVDLLYIDDFFKTATGKGPTAGDVNLAFEIINSRYADRSKITILSCELYVDDIIAIDEAVGSRIYQRTKPYCLAVGRDQAKNYRLRREKEDKP